MARRAERNDGGRGTLFIIGGHEDRTGERRILQEVVLRARGGRIVVATVASAVAGELWQEYEPAFKALGARDLHHLDIDRRATIADEDSALTALEDAGVVFFTGGDQLRITSKLGGTKIAAAIAQVHERGGVIAGTSAGASVMSETMLVSGVSDDSHDARGSLRMAPGLGFVRDMVVDQHFAQRGRIGRLLAAVAQNPRILGVGIDEDTAFVVEGDRCRVLGSGAVYIVDGSGVTHTNVSDGSEDEKLVVHDIRLHVLADGAHFDRRTRRPLVEGVSAEPKPETTGARRTPRAAPSRRRGRAASRVS